MQSFIPKDGSNEGWGAHLEQAKGLWSVREKRLHINVLELKAVSLALQNFTDQCQNQTVLVATDNSTVIAYINKQGGTHLAELCTAIVDTLGPAGLPISQSSELNRLLSSFHRDRPKSSRNLPKWNLSVVLNELTKAPFEPMKDTDLKHFTLKTAFLLALASGKCHSEIHAWVTNKVSNLGQ